MDELIQELKQKIISSLKLDVTPEEIGTDAPLFGEGLGLDSIDALELVVMLEKEYGIIIKSMNKDIWESPRALAAFVHEHRDGKGEKPS